MMIRIFGLVLALLSTAVWANGTLQYVQGQVQVTTAGVTSPIAKGGVAVTGSTVSTGANSRAVLSFPDGEVLTLGSNSALKIQEYSYNKDEPDKDNMVLSFLRGTLRAFSGQLGGRNPRNFRMTTPTATVGIRGTIYELAIDGEKLYATVSKGEIVISNAAGNVLVSAGQAGLAASSAAPELISSNLIPAGMFDEVTSISIVPGAGGASSLVIGGTAAAGGAAAVAIPVVAIGAGIAGVISAVGSSGDPISTPAHHTGTAVTHGVTNNLP